MSWCQQRLMELKEIQKERELTEEEWDTYNYCDGTLKSEDWERDYFNGELEENGWI